MWENSRKRRCLKMNNKLIIKKNRRNRKTTIIQNLCTPWKEAILDVKNKISPGFKKEKLNLDYTLKNNQWWYKVLGEEISNDFLHKIKPKLINLTRCQEMKINKRTLKKPCL